MSKDYQQLLYIFILACAVIIVANTCTATVTITDRLDALSEQLAAHDEAPTAWIVTPEQLITEGWVRGVLTDPPPRIWIEPAISVVEDE